MDDDALQSIAADRVPGSVTRLEQQRTRPGNETARIERADRPPVYLKLATDTDRRLARETATLRALSDVSIETPTVVESTLDAEPFSLVTTPLPGTQFNEPWTDNADREPLVREVGRALARVHEATIDRHDRPGTIAGYDDGLTVDPAPWPATLRQVVERRADDWFADRFSDLPGEIAEAVSDFAPRVERPALLHTDPSRLNVHLDPLGLIDWERAVVGDPAYDLVEARFHHLGQPDVDDHDRLREALYDAYRAERGRLPPTLDSHEPLYWAVTHLLVLQTFEGWAPDLDRPTEALAADVREEAHSRIETAREQVPPAG